MTAMDALFDEFFARSPVPFFVKDLDGRFVRLNAAADALFVEREGSALGTHYSDHMDEGTAASIAAVDQAILGTGEPQLRRQTFVVGGEERYALAATFPLRDEAGEIAHFGVVILETTEAVKTEKRFRALSEHHPVAMLIARLEDNEVLLANPAFFELIGIPGEHDAAKISKARWLASAEEHEDYRRAVLSEKDRDIYECRVRHASGDWFWASVSWRRIDYDGEPAVVVSVVDIGDKKEAEAKLLDSEARLKAFLDHAPVAMYLKDADDRYAVVNKFIAQIFQRPAKDVIGMTPPQLLDPQSAKEAAEVDAIIRETREPHVREATFETPAGPRSTLSIRFPVIDEEGEIRYIGGVILDTSEVKQAEAAMRESETRLNAFLQNAPMTMFMKDEDGRFLIMNEEGGRQLAMDPEDIIGKTVEEVSPMIAKAGEPYEAEVRKTGKPVTVQQEYRLEHGRAVGLNIRFPIPDVNGEMTRVGGVFMDVTKQVVAEEELTRSRDALHQSEKMNALGSLLAGVSHELNNPLAIVVGEAAILEEEAEGTEAGEAAARIKKAAERCGRIVQTFLAMARQKEPQRTETDLNALIKSSLELAAYGLRSDGIEVVEELDPDLPKLSADPDQIAQVLLNLIMNASQALQLCEGERRLMIRTSRTNDGMARIDLIDNGPGVPEDIRRRIFEPFFTTKSVGSGTGIGLSFSHGIAEAHGGALSLEPSEAGAHFRLELPIGEGEERVEEVTPTPTPVEGGKRVLVVDDEEELAGTLKRMLEREGMQVEIAVGGAQAIATLEEGGAFDLILSDLRMPDVDGPAFYRWIEENRPEYAKRFGVVTGDILGPSATRFLSDVDLPVLEKPFSRGRLRALIESFF
ncbi:hybrid sensor histidine kinase/response regulator [Sphingomicrobium sediminis]|uniref:histidine kinase n=1 Tax=Sphingomicrobium sediminis TaxID=2950949 RepID=A0A9X2EGJ3_9SPHN|nr:PAS domain S-box protein [Sphingomicrobium sediminis]MCM8557625.1 PAS domain S-box protein [Sphingomicrobium sediminis]